MNFFIGIFQRFCLHFRNLDLRQHLWATAFVYFKRLFYKGVHVSQENIALGGCLNMKIPQSKIFQGVANKYCGSGYFPANNYWGVHFSRECLLTITAVAANFCQGHDSSFDFVTRFWSHWRECKSKMKFHIMYNTWFQQLAG